MMENEMEIKLRIISRPRNHDLWGKTKGRPSHCSQQGLLHHFWSISGSVSAYCQEPPQSSLNPCPCPWNPSERRDQGPGTVPPPRLSGRTCRELWDEAAPWPHKISLEVHTGCQMPAKPCVWQALCWLGSQWELRGKGLLPSRGVRYDPTLSRGLL